MATQVFGAHTAGAPREGTMIITRHAATASLCVVAALSGARPALANDTTISCKSPPKESASVAFHPGTQVTYTQDTQKGTCTFSVNGAVATSPPAEAVLSALNLFRGGKPPPFNDIKTMAPAIAALLAAPAPVDKVPDELVSLLTKADGLTRCLSEFFEKRVFPSVELKELRFSCKGLEPYRNADGKAQLLQRGEPAVGVPTLMISVAWQQGRFVSALYLPLSILQMPPIR
jgi:hypothetical protein